MFTQVLNIRGSEIGAPGTTGEAGFILSKREWIEGQSYVTDAFALDQKSACKQKASV
ncbi:MAG: hypothetical protein L0H63_08705 [Nitrococcus sp.]|nr:hypothetical protein [Nitrococcus sp.]